MIASLLLQNDSPWLPHNDEHLRAILMVVRLAPQLDACLHDDNDDDVSAVTGACWAALAAAERAYDLPRTPARLSLKESRRLIEIYDAVWFLMEALRVLSTVPQPTRDEDPNITRERRYWGARTIHCHRELSALLEGP